MAAKIAQQRKQVGEGGCLDVLEQRRLISYLACSRVR